MTYLDQYLQMQRIKQVMPYIEKGNRILDIGCGDGRLLRQLWPAASPHVGIDPDMPAPIQDATFQCLPIDWKAAEFHPHSFQIVTLLAVWEHIPLMEQDTLIVQIKKWLEPSGKIILTIPHPWVDQILPWLQRLHLIQGMHLEEHYGFNIHQTIPQFKKNGCQLIRHQPFQLGLNHLFVFHT